MIVGAPPTLEWIAVDRLQVDPGYQRATEGPHSRRIIFGMVKSWDWRLCQPLAVSRRDDGALFVVDGQHRLAGARERGDVPHLPCVVTAHADPADEAHTFVSLNQKRQKLSNGDVFNAMVAAGDADALRAAQLVADAGLGFARHGNPTAWKAGQLFNGPAIVKALRLHGEVVVRNVLTAMAEAFAGQVLVRAATIFNALLLIYTDDANRAGFDPDRFIAALGSLEQLDWVAAADDTREQRNRTISAREAMAVAFMEAYDLHEQAAAA